MAVVAISSSHSQQESHFDRISQKSKLLFKHSILFCVYACQSSLLSAILGELSRESGVVKVEGELTYTSQQPWILPGTIRSNILFGKELNPQKYDSVLKACALKRVRITVDYDTPRCIFILCSLAIRRVELVVRPV